MSPLENIHAQTGAYALDALDDLERVRFEAHMDTCDDCAEEVAAFLDTTALIGAVDEVPISAEFRAAVLEGIDGVRQVGPARPRINRVVPRLASVAAVVLAVAVLGLSVVTSGLRRELDQVEPLAAVAEIIQADDAVVLTETIGGASVKIVASPSSGAGAILARDMADLPTDRAYQLWLITDAGEALSAGFLEIDADGSGDQLMRGDMDGVIAIGISIEPAGGSTAPTTDPIVVVPLSA